jgi:predicted small secreted protein
MKKITIILTLTLISLLLITSCNTADEGVFQRIRESVPKVDVGSVDIIGITADDSTLYAYTSKKGFQSYAVNDINNPTSLSINNVYPGLYTADNSLNIGNIYFAERADANTANNLYTYDIALETTSAPDDSYTILQMRAQHDLMLVETGTKFSVLSVSDAGYSVNQDFDGLFNTTLKPTVLSQTSTQFIVSGINDDTDPAYVHYYLDSDTAIPEDLSSTVGTFDDYPIVAMMMTSTNFLVVINSLGDVWAMDTASTYNSFNLVGRIPNFPDDRDPADMPYPFFIYNNTIILQNVNNIFYEITGTAITELDDIDTPDYSQLIEKMNNIQAKSYLVDAGTLYVGTMLNGIFALDLPDVP